MLAIALGWLVAACSGPLAPGGNREAGSVPGYRVLRDVQLPGDTSRWDYLAYEQASGRLYIAHLGASQVVVFDVRSDRVVHVIDGIDTVHGLVLAPDLGRLFASATGSNRLVAIDLATFHPVGTAPTQQYPDGVAYAPNAGRLFISNEAGSGDTVIDARTVQRITDLQLGGDIGNSQYDPATQLVYVAVGSDKRLVAIDPTSASVVRQYVLAGCDGAHGVQIDEPGRHRAFIACQGNARMVTVDLARGKSDGTFSVGANPDVLALDSGIHRLYVAAESGQLTVFDVADGVKKLAEGAAGPNAHSVAVNPRTHVVYLPVANVGGRSVLRELVPG